MTPAKVSVNVLPEGSSLCGWCEDEKTWRRALADQCAPIERRLRTMATWPRYDDERPWLLEMADELARLRRFGTEGPQIEAEQPSLLEDSVTRGTG